MEQIRAASRKLLALSDEKIAQVLKDLSEHLQQRQDYLLEENAKDLARMDEADPKYDRLLLNEARIEGMAKDLVSVATLPSPLGEVLEQRTLDNGLELKKVRVPLGVVGIIYESRPNVTFDVFAICLKSGNAIVLKGGSDAKDSNRAGVTIIKEVLQKHGLDENILHLLPPTREAVDQLLNAEGIVDIIIPRGSQGLINEVRKKSKVPVIETGAGICHTYLDEGADLEMAREVLLNAKTRRVSVCNALDTLLLHESWLPDLRKLIEPFARAQVEILADERAYRAMEGHYSILEKAGPNTFGTEFLSLKMAIKTVSGVQEAIDHITKYSSKHSEAILSSNDEHIRLFLRDVDAACVYANASTAFTDGGQFGMGAEIGISTQKLHARGPMALGEMTSYKWLIEGTGQVRLP